MKCLNLLLVLLLLGFFGCTDGNLLEVDSETASFLTQPSPGGDFMAKNTVHFVPIKGKGFVQPTTDPRADLGVVCEVGEIEYVKRADLIATHIGNYTYFANGCFDGTTFAIYEFGISTAANGDTFFWEAEGRFIPPSFDLVVGEITVTGGTGRFENASTPPGEPWIFESKHDWVTYTSEVTWTGRISSVGSSKKGPKPQTASAFVE